MSDKPKTSTLDKMSIEDLALVNKLVTLCGNLYYKTAYPSKPGPHCNPSEIDQLKSQILLLSLKMGERLWFPRGSVVIEKKNRRK